MGVIINPAGAGVFHKEPDVRIRRVVLDFDDFSTVEEAVTAYDLISDGSTPLEGLSLRTVTGTGTEETMGVQKVLSWTQQAANGSSVHTGNDGYTGLIFSLGHMDYMSGDPKPVNANLLPLDLQAGDRITTAFLFNVERVTNYAGADAGGNIYPGVMYNQRDDWTGKSVRFWTGSYWTGAGMPQQQLQFDYFFGACIWTNPAVNDWGGAAMAVAYDEVWPSPGLGNIDAAYVPTLTLIKLWRENQIRLNLASVEIVARRGESAI